MNVQQWAIVIGAVIAVILALLPWMFKVWGKLTEVSTQMAGVEEDVKQINAMLGRLFEADRKRLTHCVQHEAKLGDHERRIGALEENRKGKD